MIFIVMYNSKFIKGMGMSMKYIPNNKNIYIMVMIDSQKILKKKIHYPMKNTKKNRNLYIFKLFNIYIGKLK